MFVWKFSVQTIHDRKTHYCVAASEHDAMELARKRHVKSARTEIVNLIPYRRPGECTPRLLKRLCDEDMDKWRMYWFDEAERQNQAEIRRGIKFLEKQQRDERSIAKRFLDELGD